MPKCSYCWKNEVEDYVYQEKMMCDKCVEATSQPSSELGDGFRVKFVKAH